MHKSDRQWAWVTTAHRSTWSLITYTWITIIILQDYFRVSHWGSTNSIGWN